MSNRKGDTVMSTKLLLGTSRTIITPIVGGNLYGYSPDVYSTCVNDDLTATAFAFSQGDTSAILITLTIGSINTQLANETIGRISDVTGIDKGNIIICATHTHSAPSLTGTVGWGEIDRKYYDDIFLPNVLKAAKEASENKVPVRMGYSQGNSTVGINRRELKADNTIDLGQNPWGPVDKRMTVISFENEDGERIANLIHYGCHGTASGKNTEITRDWSGVMTDVIERDFGGLTAFINGPEGDVGPRMPNGRTVGIQMVQYAMELGGYAARDAKTIADNLKVYRDADLSVYSGEVKIPLAPRMPLEIAKAEYEKVKEDNVNHLGLYAEHCRATIESYEKGETDKEYRSYGQTIIRIGDIAIVSFPFEQFCEIGMRIDTYCTEIPYVLSLSNSNGSEGYFATESERVRGGYEIKMCDIKHIQKYAENADYALICETLENLKKV